MHWHTIPDINDMINILQEQGYCSFNPTTLKETVEEVNIVKKSKTALKLIEENKCKEIFDNNDVRDDFSRN